jgi:hypothetical protein
MEEENRPDNCPPCPVCEERLKKEEEETKKKEENTGFFGRLFGVGKKAEKGLQETQDKAVEAVKAQGDKAKEGIKDLGRTSGQYARALVGMEPEPAVEKTQEGGKKHRRKHKKHTKKHHKSNLKKGTTHAKSKKSKHTKKVRFAKRK